MQLKPKRKPTLLTAARLANRSKNSHARAEFNNYLNYNQFNKLTRLEASGKTSEAFHENLSDKTLVDIINEHGLKPNYSGKQKPQELEDIRALVCDEVRSTMLQKIYRNQPAVAKAMLNRE